MEQADDKKDTGSDTKRIRKDDAEPVEIGIVLCTTLPSIDDTANALLMLSGV